MTHNREETPTIARGDRVMLRDRLPCDVERLIYWQTHGEWRFLDAPWEGEHTSLTDEQEAELRKKFTEACQQDKPWPRQRATIATLENQPLGWVNRYAYDGKPDAWPGAWFVGIDICEDAYLGKGLGSEALSLWVDYLFANSDVYRLGLDTWSFNPRMMRVAEKVGFIYEGSQRQLREWQGDRLDFVHFGLLRSEWEARRAL